MKEFAMFTFQHKGKRKPTILTLSKKFNLKPDDFDFEFGVVEVDPETKTYCVMMDSKEVEKMIKPDSLSGPFSNPKIEPF